MFAIPAVDGLLTQGDIVDDCPLFGANITLPPEEWITSPSKWSARVIVMTQACDLAQTKTSRVQVAVMHDAQQLVDQGLLKAVTIRDQIRRHQVFGWYFLPAVAAPVALPESLVDLRDLHTLPMEVLEKLILDGKRLGRLVTPYREHMAQHFAVTYSRIALPEQYETQP